MSSFHYEFILSKRSSLAKVWLAAHWEKKLSKVQVFETDLQTIVKDILSPKTPMALRTSSHLLFGLVRIYSRKAKYLLKDCSDTLVNIKVTFRPGVDALDKGVKRKRSRKDIMDCPLFITENVDLLDKWIPDVSHADLDCTLNQSKIEEITLKEEPMNVSSCKDYFDDEGFGEMEIDSIDITENNLNNSKSSMERVYSFADSAYGTDDPTLSETVSLTDCSDPFSSLTPAKTVLNSPNKIATDHHAFSKLFLNLDDDPPAANDHIDEEHCPRSSLHNEALTNKENLTPESDLGSHEKTEDLSNDIEAHSGDRTLRSDLNSRQEDISVKLFSEETSNDGIILEPVDTTQKKTQSCRKNRKRKLLIDEVISIERAVIFDNLNNPSRHLSPPVFAARTKRRMKQIENDDIQLLLSKGSLLESISPELASLFHPTKSGKISDTDISKTTTAQDNENEEELDKTLSKNEFDDDFNEDTTYDISALFIPLQDDEFYSSDEEGLIQSRLHIDENIHPLPSPGNSSTNDDDENEASLLDENISEDAFCSHVEATVLQCQPHAVKFQEVVHSNERLLTRKTVARRFLKCLIMQRDARLTLEQNESFKDILLHPGLKHVSKV